MALKIPLDREFFLESPLELVLPENSDESGLIIALERKDCKRMPPEENRYAPLKLEVVQVILDWIESGAN